MSIPTFANFLEQSELGGELELFQSADADYIYGILPGKDFWGVVIPVKLPVIPKPVLPENYHTGGHSQIS